MLQSQATNRYDMQKKILKVLIFMYGQCVMKQNNKINFDSQKCNYKQ